MRYHLALTPVGQGSAGVGGRIELELGLGDSTNVGRREISRGEHRLSRRHIELRLASPTAETDAADAAAGVQLFVTGRGQNSAYYCHPLPGGCWTPIPAGGVMLANLSLIAALGDGRAADDAKQYIYRIALSPRSVSDRTAPLPPPDPAPVPKRRRETSPSAIGTAPSLFPATLTIAQMPADVFEAVFAALDPVDLGCFSAASKGCYAIAHSVRAMLDWWRRDVLLPRATSELHLSAWPLMPFRMAADDVEAGRTRFEAGEGEAKESRHRNIVQASHRDDPALRCLPPEMARFVGADAAGCGRLIDVAALGRGGVEYVCLDNCGSLRDLSPLRGAKVVRIRGCCVKDLSPLQSVERLNANGCRYLRTVPALPALRVCDLAGTSVQDVTALGKLAQLERLSLAGCPRLSDVSSLGRVRALDLSQCPKVVDVSALGAVHRLNLSSCAAVTSCAGLAGCWVLDLSGTGVCDVSPLAGAGSCIRTLALRGCKSIADVAALGACPRLEHLDLTATLVADVSALGGIHTLTLAHCGNVRDASALGGVRVLDLSYTSVRTVGRLGGCRVLNLKGAARVTDTAALTGIEQLIL